MRIIKFRAKRIDTGKFAYGDLIHRNDGDVAIYTYLDTWVENQDDVDAYGDSFRVAKSTIGQFTGLCDKNGKEIYEGDIVKWEEFSIPIIGIISWRDFGFCVEYYRPTGTKVRYMLSEYDEVIGNIHDNHELLKQQEL